MLRVYGMYSYDPLFANIAVGVLSGSLSFAMLTAVYGLRRKYKHPIRNRRDTLRGIHVRYKSY
jgi:hypothetical protein